MPRLRTMSVKPMPIPAPALSPGSLAALWLVMKNMANLGASPPRSSVIACTAEAVVGVLNGTTVARNVISADPLEPGLERVERDRVPGHRRGRVGDPIIV